MESGFYNQDIVNQLDIHECKELADIKEIKHSLYATIKYLEGRESSIFQAVRARLPKIEGEEKQ